jgi:hypothetical protein
MSSGSSRPPSVATSKSGHKSFSISYQNLGLSGGLEPVARERPDKSVVGGRFGEGTTPVETGKIFRGQKTSNPSVHRGARAADTQPSAPEEARIHSSSARKRPPSGSGLHFHTASEWADALTSSIVRPPGPASPVRKTPWLAPEDQSGRWAESGGRFDGTATVTRLISTIHGDHYDSHWLNRAEGGGTEAMGDAIAAGIPQTRSYSPLSRPGSAKSRPRSAASSKQLLKQKHGLDVDVDSPRQATYLDGIVVKLGKPLPRACLCGVRRPHCIA